MPCPLLTICWPSVIIVWPLPIIAWPAALMLVGILLSIAIWTTAEGFGGPYGAGSTDIGAAILYPLMFAGLFLSSAGLYYGVDRRLTAALGRFGYLASGGYIRKPAKAPIGKPIATS